MSKTNETGNGMSRRALLARLGLGATAAYMAPVALQLSEASASSFSRASRSLSRPRRRARTTRRSFSR